MKMRRTVILNGLVSVCDKGAYRDDDDACALCRNNTYKNVTGDDECSPCDNRTITLEKGASFCGMFHESDVPLIFSI